MRLGTTSVNKGKSRHRNLVAGGVPIALVWEGTWVGKKGGYIVGGRVIQK